MRDDKNYEMKIKLWGRRATDFPAQLVIDEGQHRPVPAIIVGMLMRSFLGEDFLGGNSACRWYINPDDPRANNLAASFADRFEPLALIEGTTEPARPRVLANQTSTKHWLNWMH